MYLWRKRAAAKWLAAHEEELELRSGSRLVSVAMPGKRLTQLEIVCPRKTEAREFVQDFGGTIESVPRDWLARSARMQQSAPLRIGKRLVVQRDATRDFKDESQETTLVIPAEAAFGTGDHATTAMSLRLLEGISRRMNAGWSCADLGTGSGILALAARRFGAGAVEAIDHDPCAISTAKWNAKRNRVRGINFHVADVTKWRGRQKSDVIIANLFSELLIQAMPRVRRSLRVDGKVVLSGIMRSQERSVVTALRRNAFHVEKIRRRGKWVALLAQL